MFGTRIQTEVFTRCDVRNMLLATERASALALQAGIHDDAYAEGYQAGFQAAIMSLALAFGLVQPGKVDEWRLIR